TRPLGRSPPRHPPGHSPLAAAARTSYGIKAHPKSNRSAPVLNSICSFLSRRRLAAACSAAAVALAACGGGGGASEPGGTGTMRVALTDAPACGYDAVNVTIERVRVHQSSSAGDHDTGWSDLVVSPRRRVNLLALTNGVLEELGEMPLPSGRYTQMRL